MAGEVNAEATAGAEGKQEEQKQAEDVKITLTKSELEAKLKSESDKRVTQALETSKAKWETEHKEALKREREEAERLALMSVEERTKELEKQRIKELEDRESKLSRREIQLKAIKKLDTESLPVSFAEILLGNDETQTMTNIETFKKSWQTAIDAEVTRRLKGKTPQGGESSGSGVDMNALIRKSAGRR